MAFKQQFRAAQLTTNVLVRFESGDSLVAYLASTGGDLDEKDQIYAAIVRAVQHSAAWAPLAQALIWCGMWPALDRLWRRGLALCPEQPDDLLGEIALALSALIHRMNLGRVRRVAALLARSTARDVMFNHRHARKQIACWARELDGDVAELGPEELCHSEVGLPIQRCLHDEMAALHERLAPISGGHTDLVLRVAVLGETRREAAEHLGLSHGTARKALQRALTRIRMGLSF